MNNFPRKRNDQANSSEYDKSSLDFPEKNELQHNQIIISTLDSEIKLLFYSLHIVTLLILLIVCTVKCKTFDEKC
jgi:hypothetical protein